MREANQASGLLHSMLYLYAAAQRSGRLTPDRAAALLLDYVKGMQGEQTPRAWAAPLWMRWAPGWRRRGRKRTRFRCATLLVNVPDAR